ncbi:hypothetical protein CEF21_17785 [Bacillus sp. FJAT-42376]|nr:hypothetical protein CEF21_17785 [Bacillus sp. FJAT-42376]
MMLQNFRRLGSLLYLDPLKQVVAEAFRPVRMAMALSGLFKAFKIQPVVNGTTLMEHNLRKKNKYLKDILDGGNQ